MSQHADDCDYWNGNQVVLFASSGGVERVKIGYDRGCDLLIVSGYYEGVDIDPDELIKKLVALRKERPS